jgi:hypothetical protein
MTPHVIEIDYDLATDRNYWARDCGAAGSVSNERGAPQVFAEKHVGEGEPVSYRYRGAQ